MKFIIVAAIATLAIASPNHYGGNKCKPATYSCTPNAEGWQVCNTSGQWVVSFLFSPM